MYSSRSRAQIVGIVSREKEMSSKKSALFSSFSILPFLFLSAKEEVSCKINFERILREKEHVCVCTLSSKENIVNR